MNVIVNCICKWITSGWTRQCLEIPVHCLRKWRRGILDPIPCCPDHDRETSVLHGAVPRTVLKLEQCQGTPDPVTHRGTPGYAGVAGVEHGAGGSWCRVRPGDRHQLRGQLLLRPHRPLHLLPGRLLPGHPALDRLLGGTEGWWHLFITWNTTYLYTKLFSAK